MRGPEPGSRQSGLWASVLPWSQLLSLVDWEQCKAGSLGRHTSLQVQQPEDGADLTQAVHTDPEPGSGTRETPHQAQLRVLPGRTSEGEACPARIPLGSTREWHIRRGLASFPWGLPQAEASQTQLLDPPLNAKPTCATYHHPCQPHPPPAPPDPWVQVRAHPSAFLSLPHLEG